MVVRPASIAEETINVNILHTFCIYNGFPDTQIMAIYYLTDCSFKMSLVLPRDLMRTYHYEFFCRHSWKKFRNRLFTFDCREWFNEIENGLIIELIHIYCIFLKDGLNIFHIP